MNNAESTFSENDVFPSSNLITLFIKEVFGTYFIEHDDWKFPSVFKVIGRTFFADRRKKEKALNERAFRNLYMIYELALTGQSSFDPEIISHNFAKMVKNNFHLNVDYLMFFPDDGEELRREKAYAIRHLMVMMLRDLVDKPSYTHQDFEIGRRVSFVKLIANIRYYSGGTYTETVLKNLSVTDLKVPY